MEANMCVTKLWIYLLITLITAVVGAIGAILLDKEATIAAFGKTQVQKGEEANYLAPNFPREWIKKLVLGFIAAAATPLFLYLSNKSEVFCELKDNECCLLVYVGYSLILATFGEAVVRMIFELIKSIKEGFNKLFGINH